MTKAPRKSPDEFYIVVADGTPIDDIKDSCSVHVDEDEALATAAADSQPPYEGSEKDDRFPYLIYRVQRFWKVGP